MKVVIELSAKVQFDVNISNNLIGMQWFTNDGYHSEASLVIDNSNNNTLNALKSVEYELIKEKLDIGSKIIHVSSIGSTWQDYKLSFIIDLKDTISEFNDNFVWLGSLELDDYWNKTTKALQNFTIGVMDPVAISDEFALPDANEQRRTTAMFQLTSDVPIVEIIEPAQLAYLNQMQAPTYYRYGLVERGVLGSTIIVVLWLDNLAVEVELEDRVKVPYKTVKSTDINVRQEDYDVFIINRSEVPFVKYNFGQGWVYDSVMRDAPIGLMNVGIKDIYDYELFGDIEVVAQSNEGILESVRLSKSNSIRFAEINNKLPNDDNLLSCDSLDEIADEEIQVFDKGDVVITQVISDKSLMVLVDGVRLNASGKTLDANSKNYSPRIESSYLDASQNDPRSGKIGLGFKYRSEYSDNSFLSILSAHQSSMLPVGLIKGTYVKLYDSSKSVIFSNLISYTEYDAIKMEEFAYLDFSGNIEVSDIMYMSYADVLLDNEKIWEFSINMSDYVNKKPFQVEISTIDSSNKWISEKLQVVMDLSEYVEIKWSMTHSTDMYYSTGIVNKMWLMYDKMTALVDASVEEYKTDTDVNQTGESSYEVEEITFTPITKEIARKAIIAFTHDMLYINDVKYTTKSVTIGQLEKSNLYTVVVQLIKGGNSVYYTKGGSNYVSTTNLVDSNDNNFVKF